MEIIFSKYGGSEKNLLSLPCHIIYKWQIPTHCEVIINTAPPAIIWRGKPPTMI